MAVAVVCEKFAPKIKGTDVGNKCADLLRALKSDSEFDVTYFASRALK